MLHTKACHAYEQLSEARRALPLRQRLERAKVLAEMGASAPAFDVKAYTDEMWGKT